LTLVLACTRAQRGRWRANSAQTRQLGPGSGLGLSHFQAKDRAAGQGGVDRRILHARAQKVGDRFSSACAGENWQQFSKIKQLILKIAALLEVIWVL